MKLAISVFTVLCCAIFSVQLVVYIRDALSSTKLYTEMMKIRLSDQPLPLVVSICLKPGLNQTELWAAGYENELSYISGMSRYNSSVFGWGGHTADGKYMHTNISVLWGKLLIWNELSDVVSFFVIAKKFSYEIVSDKMTINSMVETVRYFFGVFCFTLKPNLLLQANHFNMYLQPKLTFKEIEVKLSDINL